MAQSYSLACFREDGVPVVSTLSQSSEGVENVTIGTGSQGALFIVKEAVVPEHAPGRWRVMSVYVLQALSTYLRPTELLAVRRLEIVPPHPNQTR